MGNYNISKLDNKKYLKAPFPYFGGKSKVIGEVWKRFGQVKIYVEPFFGGGSVLLGNPYWQTTFEAVNDKDHMIANAWRSLKNDPDGVFKYCDNPSIEIDFHLNHIWLVNEGKERIKRCEWDKDFYDVEVAGIWILGMSNVIGSQYASGVGKWNTETLKLASELGTYNIKEITKYATDNNIDIMGSGVDRSRPSNTALYNGINRKNMKAYENYAEGDEIFPPSIKMREYLRELAVRLKYVKVYCGDWTRVTTKPMISKDNHIGAIFLDPPYSLEANRDKELYVVEDLSVAHDVRQFCIEKSDDPKLRIALCGYDDEHTELEQYGYVPYYWSTHGGYSLFAKEEAQSRKNKNREVIWFSKSCNNE